MTRALIVVDVQPTFCEGGELPVEGGNRVASDIDAFMRENHGYFKIIASSQDWHINPGGHFSENPDYIDSWPPHGIAGSKNAHLHPSLSEDLIDAHFFKGMYEAAYSAFDGVDSMYSGMNLTTFLTLNLVSEVFIVGIAESHCVAATALDAKRLGYDTYVIEELTVPVSEELGQLARESMKTFGVEYISVKDF